LQEEGDGSTDLFGPDTQAELSPPAERSTARHQLPSALRSNARSCLKSSGNRKHSPKPPLRSVSAGHLSLQIHLPGQKKTIVRTRSITFDESVKVRRIPSAAELNEGNTNDLWFQAEEYDKIKKKTYSLIRAVKEGNTGGSVYCTRGLEKFFNAEVVQVRRTAAWDSVLDEQDFQRRNGSFDDLRLCKAAENQTRKSMVEAAKRGKLDEDAIERYVKRTRQNLRATKSMPIVSTAAMRGRPSSTTLSSQQNETFHAA
jgi:hypothetical protein